MHVAIALLYSITVYILFLGKMNKYYKYIFTAVENKRVCTPWHVAIIRTLIFHHNYGCFLGSAATLCTVIVNALSHDINVHCTLISPTSLFSLLFFFYLFIIFYFSFFHSCCCCCCFFFFFYLLLHILFFQLLSAWQCLNIITKSKV